MVSFVQVRAVIMWFIVNLIAQNTAVLLLALHLDRQRRTTFFRQATSMSVIGLPPLPSKPRACWMRVRSRDWWNRIVLQEFCDQEWRENFRMSRRSFVKLCDMMKEVMSPAPDDMTVRPAIPLEMRVAIALYKLGSCGEYRLVANQFGVHKSTVLKFVRMFCRGMVTQVAQDLIKIPSLEEALAISQRFEARCHIPQIIGCIDGTHIPVLAPSDGYRDFVNRKGWTSYVLQGVVDDKLW